MSIDEQRAFARSDGRDADGPEVIGDASNAADHRPGTLNGFERPTEPQPVTWPAAAAPPQDAQHTQPLNDPVAAAPADPWGQPTGDPWIDVTPGGPTTGTAPAPADGRGRRFGAAIGLIAAGAVAGALVTGIATGWGSNDASALTSQNGSAPGSAIQPGAQPPGQGLQGQLPGAGQNGQSGQSGQGANGQGFAGRDGEVRLVGTLTAVTGSKVTVKSTTGSATYTISATTRILRNGAAAQASALRVGDVVLVHVFPSSSGDGVLELIYARGTASASNSSSDDGSTT